MTNFGLTFTTTNRKLENFLYMHAITPQSWHKTEDMLTAWVYPVTDKLTACVEEYKSIYPRDRV